MSNKLLLSNIFQQCNVQLSNLYPPRGCAYGMGNLHLKQLCLNPLAIKTRIVNPLRAKPTKWSNTLKQVAGNSRQNAEC